MTTDIFSTFSISDLQDIARECNRQISYYQTENDNILAINGSEAYHVTKTRFYENALRIRENQVKLEKVRESLKTTLDYQQSAFTYTQLTH